jgi:hypothetical protein
MRPILVAFDGGFDDALSAQIAVLKSAKSPKRGLTAEGFGVAQRPQERGFKSRLGQRGVIRTLLTLRAADVVGAEILRDGKVVDYVVGGHSRVDDESTTR